MRLAQITMNRKLWKHLNEAEDLIYLLHLETRGDILELEVVDKLREMRKIIKEDLEEQGADLE